MSESTLEIEKIQDTYSLEGIREEWNALLEKSETRTVELSFEWQATYWKYFNNQNELFVLIVRESGKAVAIVPLKITLAQFLGIKIRRLEIIAAAETNYQDLIIGENSQCILNFVFGYLMQHRRDWDILDLRHIPESSSTVNFFLDPPGVYPIHKVIQVEKCMFLEINEGSIDDLSGQRNHNRSRRRLMKQVRKLERNLGEPFIKRSTAQQMEPDLKILFDMHRRRWNRTDTPSMFNDRKYREFYLDASKQLIMKGQIELTTLVAGKTPLAQTLNFTYGKNIVGQLLVYDIDYLEYSPEKVLLDLYISELSSNRTNIFDFGSYNFYKRQWTNRLKNRSDIQIFPRKFYSDSLFVLTVLYGATRNALRKIPVLLSAIKHIRGMIRSLINISRYRAN